MMPRLFLCLLLVQAAAAFVPQSRSSTGPTKLTTVGVGASVAWDAAVEERKPKFSWIRRPISRILRIQKTVESKMTEAKKFDSIVDDAVARTAVVVPHVVPKPQEFRIKPLRIPSQPRPVREERKLAAKYAAIESLEERAFQILLDLNMVEMHN